MINKSYYIALIILPIFAFNSCSDKETETGTPSPSIEVPEGYSLVWSDEFNGSSINSSNWNYEIGDGTDYGLKAGWGNKELQLYTNDSENSGIVNDGDASSLYIKALSDGAGGFSSAKLTTNRLVSVRFGRVEVRAKMPKGQGMWPAIWMLGDNIDQIDWPGCGEMDLAEVIGNEPSKLYSTVHYTDKDNSHTEVQETYELIDGTFNDAYHVFSLDWTPEYLTFTVDGILVSQVPIEADMKEFLRSFYLVLNVAVGGNWPGSPDASTDFPQTMYVDYVRVFEKNGFEPPVAPVLNIEEETIGQDIDSNIVYYAIKNDFLSVLGDASIVVYGGGGEPSVGSSESAIDGDRSMEFDYPGDSWGGGYIELKNTVDLSSYSLVKFSLNKAAEIVNAEIKLESPTTDFFVYLKDYSGVDVGQGFLEYSIPLGDFTGLNLSEISIPFSMWNTQDADDNFVGGTVLIDNIHFSN